VSTRTRCIRCGTCCRTTSPTLHEEDLSAVQAGAIVPRHLVTLRVGEMVADNVNGVLCILVREMVKVKQGAEGACGFFDPPGRSCRIYDFRPIQCRELRCWNTEAIEKRSRMPRLTREVLLAERPAYLTLVRLHEERFSYANLEDAVRKLKDSGKRDPAPLLDILRYEYAFRKFVVEKEDIAPDELEFLFGRSLMDTLIMHGFCVEKDSEGDYVLRNAVSQSP